MDADSGPTAAPGAWQVALEKLGQACGLVCWFVAQARDELESAKGGSVCSLAHSRDRCLRSPY